METETKWGGHIAECQTVPICPTFRRQFDVFGEILSLALLDPRSDSRVLEPVLRNPLQHVFVICGPLSSGVEKQEPGLRILIADTVRHLAWRKGGGSVFHGRLAANNVVLLATLTTESH